MQATIGCLFNLNSELNTYMIAYTPSLAELKSRCSFYGYTVKKNGDELEAFPKGKPGTLSIFTNDRLDLLATVKAEAKAGFTAQCNTAIREVFNHWDEDTTAIREALVQWFMERGAKDWEDDLRIDAWSQGNYHGCTASGTLQRLRNSEHGHDLIAKL